MREFPERLTEQRRHPLNWVEPSYGLESPMEEGQVSRASASLSLCFQTADAMWPVTSHSFCHVSPPWWTTPLNCSPNIFPSVAFCQVSCHSYETRNWCIQCRQLNQASEWVGICPIEHTPHSILCLSAFKVNHQLWESQVTAWVSHTRSPPP